MISRREFLMGAVVGSSALESFGKVVNTGAPASQSSHRLDSHIKSEMRKAKIPGLQIAVLQQERVTYLKNFGLADVENPTAVTGDTVFQIASCTKALVGVAAMQLVERGELDLDAPIARYLEDLPPAWQPVTVGQVATHTSGLPDVVGDLGALRLIVDGDADASWTKVQTMPLEFPSGEKFSYVQTNYVVLGKIIDVLAGESFIDFIRKHQLDPVGMAHTVFGDDHDVVPRSAKTYTTYLLKRGKPPEKTGALFKVYTEFPAMLRTCGGLYSTAGDLARWLIALKRGELLRSKTSLDTLWSAPPLNDGKPGPWAIGGWAVERPEHRAFFAVGAAKAAFAIYPNDDLAVVVLSNLSANMGLAFIDGIATQYLRDLVPS